MIRVVELFAGVGACSKALTNLGIEHEIVDAVEIDKYAIKSFNAIHGTNFEPQDITKWDKDIKADLIMHGSPCQDFSVAGKNAGGDEGSGTRSSLLYETLRETPIVTLKGTVPKGRTVNIGGRKTVCGVQYGRLADTKDDWISLKDCKQL